MAGRTRGAVGADSGRRSPARRWRPVIAEASAAGSGWPIGATTRTAREPRRRDRSATAALTHQSLVSRGLTSDEAARLTSFLCGFPPPEGSWSIGQLSRLLFIRELARSGRFGERDGADPAGT